MLQNRLLLGSVAFGISFGISLITGRDFNRALLTGLITVPATVTAVFVAEYQYEFSLRARFSGLRSQIRALQRQREEVYLDFADLSAEYEQLAAELDSSGIPSQRQLPAAQPTNHKAVSWDLSRPWSTDRSRVLPPGVDQRSPLAQEQIQEQIQVEIQAQIDNLSRQETELNQSLFAATDAQRRIEANLKALQAEQEQLQRQVTEQRQTQQTLNQEILTLQGQKHQLEAESQSLHFQIQDFEHYKAELSQSLSALAAKQQEAEMHSSPLQAAVQELQAQVVSLQKELNQLEDQIWERRNEREQLERELADLQTQKQLSHELELTPNTIHSSAASVAERTLIRVADVLPQEWTELMVQLADYEVQALQALVEQQNLTATLKQIAEAQLTMPELLLDAINERALATIGDIIIEAGEMAIAPEHLPMVEKLLQIYDYLMG